MIIVIYPLYYYSWWTKIILVHLKYKMILVLLNLEYFFYLLLIVLPFLYLIFGILSLIGYSFCSYRSTNFSYGCRSFSHLKEISIHFPSLLAICWKSDIFSKRKNKISAILIEKTIWKILDNSLSKVVVPKKTYKERRLG